MRKFRNPVFILIIILFFVATACQLPQIGGLSEEATPESSAQPAIETSEEEAAPAPPVVMAEQSAAEVDLPPVVVETRPQRFGTLTTAEGLKLYFNQAYG